MSEGLLHKIDVTIIGRKFPIKVSSEEEVIVRGIEKQLNQRIKEFQLKYADKDKLDCVIMTLLTIAFEGSGNKTNPDTKEVENRLIQLEQLVDSALA